MKKNIFCLLIVLIFLLFSCTTKQDPINDLEKLCIELEEHSRSYTDQDWKDAHNKMKTIDEVLSNYDYTATEKQYIDKLKGKYLGYLVKAKTDKAKKFLKELPSKVQSTTEGLLEALINED